MMKNVELLAPAGNYEGFLGAVAAGADAVYLGGPRFGARAYAENFSNEEVIKAVTYAHLWGKKVYLTVNTLIKDAELKELPAYLQPFYEAGLDGVIVQDMGALLTIQEYFPDLPLHASTQMTVTGARGAAFLKELGVCRVVPARELSLEELQNIQEMTGVELEVFIHGAMCYSYSGQCLFSSILGGRSGNRGRCAQPCRLPYRILDESGKPVKKGEGQKQYPLSLKDMCTLQLLPKILEAGLGKGKKLALKIEGRMKRPEYVAGVTAIYRKYLDLYEERGTAGYRVEKKDLELLTSLYIRSEVGEGYYERHNGPEMLTLTSPSYQSGREELLRQIRSCWLTGEKKLPICMNAAFVKGQCAVLTAFCTDFEGRIHKASVQGEIVEAALKQPVTREDIAKGLKKLGNTLFEMKEEPQIDMEEDIFYSLKAIGELRRCAVSELEKTFLPKERAVSVRPVCELKKPTERQKRLSVSVCSQEQLRGIKTQIEAIGRIYLEADCIGENGVPDSITEELVRKLKAYRDAHAPSCQLYLAAPRIVRDSRKLFYRLLPLMDGCLIRTLESYQEFKTLPQPFKGALIADASLYQFNRKTLEFWLQRVQEATLPYELNKKEIRNLTQGFSPMQWEMIVYGRIPLMLTANCVARTLNRCQRKKAESGKCWYLEDRMGKRFPVELHCGGCFNVIYNSVPLSLHEGLPAGSGIRLQFTTEGEQETSAITEYFANLLLGKQTERPYAEYTTGHSRRGVE